MAKQYDVVIVGAGPAGLMTAKTAGESGLSIALLERQKDISEIRRTDAGVIALNEYMFGQIVKFNRRTQTLVFPVSGFSLKYEGPWNDNRYGFHFYSPGGKRFMVGDWAKLKKDPEKNSKGIALSKGLLLEGTLKEAQAFGVEYFEYNGRFVVAADGVNSRIVRSLGLNKQRKFLGTSRYFTWVMTGVRPPDAEGFIFVMNMYGTFSISQVCDEDHSHVVIMSSDPKLELEPLVERFTRDDPVFSPWFKKAKRVNEAECCVVNGWQAIEKPFYNNVIIVGDACWSEQFANPPSLSAGYQLGHALTRAFIDEKFNEEGVAQYLEWYDTNCYRPYGQQAMGGGSLVKYLTADELDYLAELVPKPVPSTASFIKMFNTLLETYQPLMPRIREERPAIPEKFRKMGEDMEKNQEERRKAGFPNK
jgi:flavin-dependent dehydrogenase